MHPATNGLSRGHLSRPACSHVKQIAKRPGTREPGRDISPAGFLLATREYLRARLKGGRNARVDQELSPRNPACACRHVALAIRRDLRGFIPDTRLRVFDSGGMRGTVF